MNEMHERSLTAGLWFLIGGLIVALIASITNESTIFGAAVLFFSAAIITLLIGTRGMSKKTQHTIKQKI